MSSELSCALLSYADGHDAGTISMDQSIALSSAEAFVADWGNHWVVALDQNRRLQFDFGSFGVNREADSGASARLAFANRIAVEQEPVGGSTPRETHIRRRFPPESPS